MVWVLFGSVIIKPPTQWPRIVYNKATYTVTQNPVRKFCITPITTLIHLHSDPESCPTSGNFVSPLSPSQSIYVPVPVRKWHNSVNGVSAGKCWKMLWKLESSQITIIFLVEKVIFKNIVWVKSPILQPFNFLSIFSSINYCENTFAETARAWF